MEITDPTTSTTEPTRYWTTANIGEATPDVLSPMCWSFWGPQAELSARRSYWRFGILAKREVIVPGDPNQLMTNYFYGRPALNVDVLRPFFGSIPGVSADDFEREMCGTLRPGLPDARRPQRLPFIAVKGVAAMWSTPRRLKELVPRQRAWWESKVRDQGPAANTDEALARLADAAERYRESFEIHCCGRFVLMSAQATLTKLAFGIERPDLVMGLLAGLGGVTEVGLADDLWQVSRGSLSIEEFVRRHGFHGPNEGNLSGVSWREDHGPVERLVGSLASRPESERPRSREQAAMAAHGKTLDEFVAALPEKQRRKAARAAAALIRSTQANELGKACYLMSIDGGRAAARELGRLHVAAGRLEDVDDIFSFTMDEVQRLPDNAREIVAFRQGRREEYRAMTLPVTFTGAPVPVERTASADEVVTGAPASPGHAEGIANVITDPDAAAPLGDGEILVCRFTDPSWTPLMLLAAALVIDIGGPTSHGAIVARELGVPCVIGTGNGTLSIRSGDRIAVDGSTGQVKILARASAALSDQ